MSEATSALNVTIAANFTADGIEESLNFWMDRLSINYSLHFAPRNQVIQYLNNPADFPPSRSGVLLVLLQLERWYSTNLMTLDLSCLSSALRLASHRSPALLIIIMFSLPSPNRRCDSFLDVLEEEFAAHSPRWDVVLSRTTEQLYPVDRYFDTYTDEIAEIPYTRLYFASLGTMAARRIRVLREPAKKLIVVDADDTLWLGAAAEGGVSVDEPRLNLQRLLLRQREAGVLLAICSKNAEGDVFDVLDHHSDMLLRRDHFSAFRINWNSKCNNLTDLSEELSLGLDSFIFIDDSPAECAQVQSELPRVLTVNPPWELVEIRSFLDSIWEFDRPPATAEDSERSLLYKQNASRSQARQEAPTLDEFFASLELEVRIEIITASALRRASQLVDRTRQFNLNGTRLTEAQLASISAQPDAGASTVSAVDRFGDYGMIGLMVYRFAEALLVDVLLLSCRALGKRIEHRMVLKLAELAEEKGIINLLFRFVPSDRNPPIRAFLDELGVKFSPLELGRVSTSHVRQVCNAALAPFMR